MIAEAPPGLRYALLLGQGRSGTNYLLHLLNQSGLTHCRNEPDQLRESAFARVHESRFVPRETQLAALWDEVVRDASLTMGARDHRVQVPKSWLFPGARKPGYFFLRQRYRIAHRIRRSELPMFGREVRFPPWMTTSRRLEQAFHVFKLNAACGLAAWMLRNRPGGKALHIVRHPGGFTKSWLRRWVDQKGAEETERHSKERLQSLVRERPELGETVGDVEAMSFVEAELWFWRYVNETIHAEGEGKHAYKRIIYEELAAHPSDVAREVFEFCGLPWDDGIAARVENISTGSKSIASAWKSELDPELVEVIEKVLDGSPMQAWWPGR